jgi:hypothetical protein
MKSTFSIINLNLVFKKEIQTARDSGAYEFIVNDDLAQAIERACKLVQCRRGLS